MITRIDMKNSIECVISDWREEDERYVVSLLSSLSEEEAVDKLTSYYMNYIDLVEQNDGDLDGYDHKYNIFNNVLKYGCSLFQDRIISLENLDGLGAIFFNDKLIASASKQLFPLKYSKGDFCWGYKNGSSTIRTANVVLNECLYLYDENDKFYNEMSREFADNFLNIFMYDEAYKIEERKVIKWIISYIKNLNENKEKEKYYKVCLKMQDEFRMIVKQYLSYFNQFVKKTSQKIIDFYVEESDDSLILNFKVESYDELEEIKLKLFEYVGFVDQKEEEITPLITADTTEYDKMMLMLDLRSRYREYHVMIENTKDQMKIVCASLGIKYNELEYISANTIIEGFKQISETLPTPNIYLKQIQYQSQSQSQELQNDMSDLINSFNDVLNNINDEKLKEEGKQLLHSIYSIATQPSEDIIIENGLLPKLDHFIKKAQKVIDFVDDTKNIYNKFAENYNHIAKILKYSTLGLL